MMQQFKSQKYIQPKCLFGRLPVFVCLVLLCLTTSLNLYSQAPATVVVPKSKTVEVIGGVKYFIHIVDKGQTLYAISKAYDRKLSDIVIENPAAIDGIGIGQILRIPIAKPKEIALTPIAPEPDKYFGHTHEVEKGQTLYALSKQYNLSIEQLVALNPEIKEGLKIGQYIKTTLPADEKKPVVKPVVSLPPLEIVAPKQVEKKKTITVQRVKLVSDTIYAKGRFGKRKPPVITVDTIISQFDSIVVVVDTLGPFYGEKKEEYNIAFILPFHAEETDTLEVEKIIRGESRFPYKTNIALQFYEGALLAIDSLKKQGLKANIFVYDIDDSDSLYIQNIIKKPELAEMDLIIGPLYGSNFMQLAKYAKAHKIPIVSPFTTVNKILFENPYVCKVLPSGILQVEQLAHYVVDSFHTQNIIVVNNGYYKESSLFKAFKGTANSLLKMYDSTAKVKEVSGFEGLLRALVYADTSKFDLVVLPSNNQSYVTEFLTKINTLHKKHKVILAGLQNWLKYDNLDFEYLNKLSLRVPTNNYIDFDDAATKNFIRKYREAYKLEPQKYGYSGFDVSYFFISSLQKYGSGFLNNIKGYHYKGIATDANYIQSATTKSGFENKSVVVLKYENYKLVKVN